MVKFLVISYANQNFKNEELQILMNFNIGEFFVLL